MRTRAPLTVLLAASLALLTGCAGSTEGAGSAETMMSPATKETAGSSIDAARRLGGELWGVRLDTASDMVDASLAGEPDAPTLRGDCALRGVNEKLVFRVREALDREGFGHVKIVVSGGFDQDKVGRFEEKGVPVDAYGVGSSLLRGNFDFTADVVKVAGRPCAKAGRRYNPNKRLKKGNLESLA